MRRRAADRPVGTCSPIGSRRSARSGPQRRGRRPRRPSQAAGRRAGAVRGGDRSHDPRRYLDHGPYTFIWVDALMVKVREDGRVVNVRALIAAGVNADGHREILGLDVTSAEDGAGCLAFLRGLVARGLSGVQLE
ncbi:mutator family transposase [Pseudonocardia cypriaca]|uniref:Mutator family transposase n=1 Tax=Pseudonocardia cypriaca TaxID=882449 RepID=A0A543FT82_9PSEU|nr:mutator family transposase [Pseudonocardia cypriaca]